MRQPLTSTNKRTVAPAEYGIEKDEKLEIGVLTSWPLLKQTLEDLLAARDSSSDGRATFYFTKESHIQTLVNLVLLSDLPIVMPQLPELDYMVGGASSHFDRANFVRSSVS